MKKTNFWKGLTLAAVALVSVFATSCSEEEIKINGPEIDVPELVLPAAKASISISVVDLEAGKIVGNVKNIDATTSIGSSLTVECPANEGYTTAQSVVVEVPALEKGQSVVIPVTFYVVTLNSAFADLMDGANIEYTDKEGEEYIIVNELTFIDANGWVNGVYTNKEAEAVTSTAKFGKYLTGYHFEDTESRAATTIEELLSYGLVFDEGIYEELVKISGMHIFTHERVYQEIHISDIVITNHEGEIIFEGTVQRAGNVIVNGYETPITHDAPGHDAPGHDNGHGNGHGAGNAGGGEGNDAGE